MNALVLAAGKARRFGLPKFLLPAGPGQVLLTRVLGTARRAVEGQIVVVVGREEGKVRYALEPWVRPEEATRVRLLSNPDYVAGLSTSLKRGVAALGDTEPVLVLLADQPVLGAGKLRALLRAPRPAGVWAVSAAENGEPKPPVVLGPELLRQVEGLEGDQGAKPLLRRYPERVRLLEWGAGEWFTDVDTWETYATLARAQGWDREKFEPIEGLSKREEIEALLDAIPEPEEYLQTLRRGVLTLLSRGF
jgi:CTP:molybdopterin cytidylyltransferase MocA